jgi:hypothetical protein
MKKNVKPAEIHSFQWSDLSKRNFIVDSISKIVFPQEKQNGEKKVI